jgi:hypothetical protein
VQTFIPQADVRAGFGGGVPSATSTANGSAR